MQLTLTPQGTISVKSKDATVSLGDTVVVRDVTIPGPGEYDVAGVLCEAQAVGESAVVYFLRIEDMQVTYLSQIEPAVSRIDDAANTEILIIDIRSDDTAEKLKPILKTIEPGFIALLGAGANETFIQGLGLPTQAAAGLKLTRTSLPQEGTLVLTF